MIKRNEWEAICKKLDEMTACGWEKHETEHGLYYTKQVFGTPFVDKENKAIKSESGMAFELRITPTKTWLEVVFICGDEEHCGNKLWSIDTPSTFDELMSMIWGKQQQLAASQYKRLIPIMRKLKDESREEFRRTIAESIGIEWQKK